MSLIKGKFARLSLRAKFKSPSEIEVVVVDHETQEEWCILWEFTKCSAKQTKVEAEKENTAEKPAEVEPQNREELEPDAEEDDSDDE